MAIAVGRKTRANYRRFNDANGAIPTTGTNTACGGVGVFHDENSSPRKLGIIRTAPKSHTHRRCFYQNSQKVQRAISSTRRLDAAHTC